MPTKNLNGEILSQCTYAQIDEKMVHAQKLSSQNVAYNKTRRKMAPGKIEVKSNKDSKDVSIIKETL
jgi:hypothetical protein